MFEQRFSICIKVSFNKIHTQVYREKVETTKTDIDIKQVYRLFFFIFSPCVFEGPLINRFCSFVFDYGSLMHYLSFVHKPLIPFEEFTMQIGKLEFALRRQ